ncbi:MAG TPA: DUF3786 domain-containing protein [Clostridiales bacterium]|nr:DUF3786 domain-containing protein [Clostridiales bacterium]
MTEENNYEKTKSRAEKEFLRYPQEEMIETCGLRADADFLYITFLNRPYRIDRKTGHVERLLSEGKRDANFNEAMTIFDILCGIKKNRYCANVWAGMEQFSKTPFSGDNLFVSYAKAFDGKTEALKAACAKYGGIPADLSGDVAYELPLFPFLPVVFRFWNGDEDLPPTLRFLWDACALDYLRFETMFYAMSHILAVLSDEIKA